MKSYKHFLTEKIQGYDEIHLDWIKDNCKPILDYYKIAKHVLVRFTGYHDDFAHVTSYQNKGITFKNGFEKPVNTWFKKVHGIPFFSNKNVYTLPIRLSKSTNMFTVMIDSFHMGMYYSIAIQSLGYDPQTASIVFPIGNFKFLNSNKIEDIAEILDTDDVKTLEHLNPKDIYNKLENANYQSTDFLKALKSENEINIYCNSYYTVNHNAMLALKIREYIYE